MYSTTRKGLFGAPMAGGGYQTPDFGIDRSADGMSTVARDAVVPTYKKPSTAKLIIGTIGDTLSQIGGGQGTYLPGLQQQRKAALEAQQYQMQRADKFTDWKMQQDYEAAHPKAQAPTEFERNLLAAGIQPGTPEWTQKNAAKVDRSLAPAPIWVPDGAGGGRIVYPVATAGGGAPQAPIGKLTPLGGAGGAPLQGARTFPVR